MKINIFQLTITNQFDGVTNYILNNLRFINLDKFRFWCDSFDENSRFKNEINDLKGDVFFRVSPLHMIDYVKHLRKIRLEKQIDIIHFNISYANILPLVLARFAGYKYIIVHSHSTQIDSKSVLVRFIKTQLHKFGRQLIPFIATDMWACSKLAAEWMFPNRAIEENQIFYAKNSVDVDKFRFSQNVRETIRKELGIEQSSLVLGHVGRLSYQKNQEFLLQVFREVFNRTNGNAHLLLIGDYDSPLYHTIVDPLIDDEIKKNIHFIGLTNRVTDYMDAMDVFVFPSRFEGLAICLIEAQINGLQCVVSEPVTKEVDISNKIEFLPITPVTESLYKAWADKILLCKKDTDRINLTEKMLGYDNKIAIKLVEERYTSIGGK